MINNVLIKSTEKDNSMGLLKKFSQKMRTSGVINKAKSLRYNERDLSFFKKKKEKLRKIKKTAKNERTLKLGKKIK